MSDSFAPKHILACAHRWLAQLIPYFTDRERRHQGYGHRLFVSQVEYCNNLIFERRAALDRLHERLLDLNRSIGAPDKIAVIFGRRILKHTDAGLKTQISDHGLGQPIIRSDYKSSSIKQYVRDHLISRTEATSYHTPDLGVNKSVENLPVLREKMAASTERYLDVQQDVLETFVDRGQLAQLRKATVTASGRRTPGLKLDDPRLLAVLQALTCFAYLAGTGCFRTKDLHQATAEALGQTTDTYTLAQLRTIWPSCVSRVWWSAFPSRLGRPLANGRRFPRSTSKSWKTEPPPPRSIGPEPRVRIGIPRATGCKIRFPAPPTTC